MEAHRQLSPALELCCLRVSAKVSYEHAAEDVEWFTGMRVSAARQQRLVHHHAFKGPHLEQPVEELSVEGGKIRRRTPPDEPCRWKEYKGVCLHEQARGAWFQAPDGLSEGVNRQPLSCPITCFGDGHEGVWNVIGQVASPSQRREILDGYHLVENLYKVETSPKPLEQAETLLWQGQVGAAMALCAHCQCSQAQNFGAYLKRDRDRILNYESYHTAQIGSIGSGAVDSPVKQIDQRTKLSGAQWKKENVPQVLAWLIGVLISMARLGLNINISKK